MKIKAIEQDPRYVVTTMGDIYFLPRGTKIEPFLNRKGYQQVKLGKHDTYSVHRLVAFAFVHNYDPENLDQVNHIDGNKENNRADNLEWVDNSGNQVHAFKLGLNNPVRGEENANAKLTEELVKQACDLFSQGYKTTQAARELGIFELRHSLRQVKERKNWKHISINYHF